MATTETRPGFRLPWTSDHRESRTTDEATPSTDETTPEAEAAQGAQAEITDTPEEHVSATAAAPSASSAPEAAARLASDEATGAGAAPVRPRPTKFLADLTKAMQAAAQAEREETLRQYREDAKGYVEQYRAEAGERATAYRREADDDVTGIRDWSKSEIARIREETERRIATRKAELEADLEDHGEHVERAIAGVQSRVDAYEAEMAAFFERLLAVDDPTAFAAMAAGMPEPPPFSPEPPVRAASTTSVTHATPAAPDPATVTAALGGASDEIEATLEPGVATATPQGDEASSPADSAWAGATWSNDTGTREHVDAAAAGPAQGSEDSAGPEEHQAPQDERLTPLAAALLEEPVDPRIAALGLAPDFAAAEAEAEAAVDLAGDGSDDAAGMVPVDDDELAARIAGLVTPSAAAAPSGETTSTQVVVVGLVSVASIAGFKRNLAHVAGVQSVSVSSGPDGEFIFSTVHDGVDLPAVIVALPGFDARVTEAGEGVIHVVAHDPEAGS